MLKLKVFSPFQFARLGSHALRDLGQGLDRYNQGKLWLKIIMGLGLGILVGYPLGEEVSLVSTNLEKTLTNWMALPGNGVMLIVGVDRILDMCRTVLNVAGDLVAAVVMNRFEKNVPS